jgi:hypothetical protein
MPALASRHGIIMRMKPATTVASMKAIGLVCLFLLLFGVSTAFAAKTWDSFATSGRCPGTMRKVANVANCGCGGHVNMMADAMNCRHGGGNRDAGGHGMRRFH